MTERERLSRLMQGIEDLSTEEWNHKSEKQYVSQTAECTDKWGIRDLLPIQSFP